MDPENEETNELDVAPTRHEAHEHASKRLYVGLGAILIVILVGGLVWSKWGDQIEEACFGDGDECSVEFNQEESAQFTIPDTYDFETKTQN